MIGGVNGGRKKRSGDPGPRPMGCSLAVDSLCLA